MSSESGIAKKILAEKARKLSHPVNLMEVCGSHSVAIARAGIRDLLPPEVRLLSGPGCPVCVSGEKFIARAVALCRRGIQVAVFGDLLRIPSPEGSLGEQAAGLHVIYSPEEALELAAADRTRECVFAAVGFAPTLAAVSALLERAAHDKLDNFSILCDFKNVRPVLDLLSRDPQASLDGFLLPGHVAAVTGEREFDGLDLPGVIAGFSPENIITSLALLIDAVSEGKKRIVNNYPAVVTKQGSCEALAMIRRYFEPCGGEWRGLGNVPSGNFCIRDEYASFDAMKKYSLDTLAIPESRHGACRCGDVLRGRLTPHDCPLFGKECTPRHPVGACMVSTEGACAAEYRYGNRSVSHE